MLEYEQNGEARASTALDPHPRPPKATMSDLGALLSRITLEDFQLPVLFRLLTAIILGGAIGLERELKGKEAGLRTNILICVGAALFAHISTVFVEFTGGPADPGRVASNIVTGVGFLGAGVIWQSGGHISGLTTAATIWVVSAVGVAAGIGQYVVAVGSTVLVLVILYPLGRFEKRRLEAERQALMDSEAEMISRHGEG